MPTHKEGREIPLNKERKDRGGTSFGKYLAYKHEGLEFDPQHPSKILGVVVYTVILALGKLKRTDLPGLRSSQPHLLGKLWVIERPCLTARSKQHLRTYA